MITIRTEPDKDVTIIVDGQPVLRISEVSDCEIINLFMEPLNGAAIQSAEESFPEVKHKWTHELLANRR